MRSKSVFYSSALMTALSLNSAFLITDSVYYVFGGFVGSLMALIISLGETSVTNKIQIGGLLVTTTLIFASSLVWGYDSNVLHLVDNEEIMNHVRGLMTGATISVGAVVISFILDSHSNKH